MNCAEVMMASLISFPNIFHHHVHHPHERKMSPTSLHDTISLPGVVPVSRCPGVPVSLLSINLTPASSLSSWIIIIFSISQNTFYRSLSLWGCSYFPGNFAEQNAIKLRWPLRTTMYSPIQRVLPWPALARLAESQEPELCGEAKVAKVAKSSSRAAASMLSTSSLTSRKPGR